MVDKLPKHWFRVIKSHEKDKKCDTNVNTLPFYLTTTLLQTKRYETNYK